MTGIQLEGIDDVDFWCQDSKTFILNFARDLAYEGSPKPEQGEIAVPDVSRWVTPLHPPPAAARAAHGAG